MSSTSVWRLAVTLCTVLALATVCLLAVTVDGRTAVATLAVLLVGAAVLRAVVPVSVVPAARSRAFDVAFLLLLALALGYLSPWGNATLPVDA